MARIAEITQLDALYEQANEAVNTLIGWAVVYGARDHQYHVLVAEIGRTMDALGATISTLVDHDDASE